MSNLSPTLDWQSVLLVRVPREPFTGTHCGLHVSRAHLALHPDGVVMSAWDVPEVDRNYPGIRITYAGCAVHISNALSDCNHAGSV